MVGKPSKIGKYDVIDVLGRGGMGVVYKATDPHLNRLVAIKMMTGGFSDNPDLLKRFYREAQSTGNLQHPNIVTVYDLGDLDGSPYLVMEYLEGETLDAIINARGSLSMLAKINYICDVCQGLAYAHHHGIVHRDIKPGNVMVLKTGGVKIVDFGIAHIGDKTVTRTGQLIGSLGYMSPEQVNGKPIDTRTDIFSTGVVLFQLLTYALPFDGDSTASTLLKIIHDPPPPLTRFITDAPAELEGVILRAMAKDREERYRTVEDFGFDLAQIRDRLKEGLVEGHLREAESLLSRGLSHKAKELLLQVLKIDRQHTGAIRLFRSVQQKIEQEQIGVQIKQFRNQAEEAFANQHFEAALSYVDKALNLHQTDAALQSLKATIQQAKLQAEELQSLLDRAEAAHQEGELDVAKKLLEEMLELAPNDLQVKALYRVIRREWEERSRREQVGNLVDSARKEIASRRFTAALDVLKEAETLDPNAPEVRSLIESAKAGREQERLRQELESINNEIEEALDHDDFVTAGETIDLGLRKFPEDRTLLKLKALAEKQRQVSERRQFINDQLAQARTLIQAGRNQEVLKLLDSAIQRVGNDPHLQSLQGIVRETVERERVEQLKGVILQRAKECLRRKEFSEAIEILEGASAEFHNDGDLVDLLHFAKEEAAVDLKRKATEAVVEKARVLIENDEYEQAVLLLEAGLPDEYEHEIDIALTQARNAAAEYQKRLEAALAAAARLLQNHKAQDAAKFLESQPGSFRRSPVYNELLQQAHRDAERWQNIENAIARARQFAGEGSFDEALRAVEECNRIWGDASELQDAAAEIQERRSADATEKLETVMADGRMLMKAKEYRAVLDRLKPAEGLAAVAFSELGSEFETLQSQAASSLIQQRTSEIEQLVVKGEHLQAADMLRESESEFPDHSSWSDLRKRLEEAVAKRSEVQSLLQEARRLFSENSWKQGGEACVRAISLAKSDPWLREQAINTMLRAAEACVDSDWQSAESLVNELARVKGNNRVSAELRKRIADKKQEAVIGEATFEVRRLQASGDLPAALKTVETALVTFPDDPSLKTLRAELQESQRKQEKETHLEQEKRQRLEYLNAVDQRLEREKGTEPRIKILEKALGERPDETTLQKKLADLRKMSERVAAQVLSARNLEQSQQYSEAIAAWEQIRTLDPQFAETASSRSSLERLRELRQKQIDELREKLIGQAQSALAAFDLGRLPELLTQTKAEFSDDRQVLDLEKAFEERKKIRSTAIQLIVEGQKLFERKKWGKGLGSIQNSLEVAAGDPVVREKALSTVVQAAEMALPVDLAAAGDLVNQAERIDPSSSSVATIKATLATRKRDAVVAQQLSSDQKLETIQDLEAALTHLKPALADYPDEPRLLERKRMLETRVMAAKAAREREKEVAQYLEFAQRLHSSNDFSGALALLNEGLTLVPDDPRLVRLKNTVEKSIAHASELQRREEERKQAERQREESQKRAEAERLEAEALRRQIDADRAAAREAAKAAAKKAKEEVALPAEPPATPRTVVPSTFSAGTVSGPGTSLNVSGWTAETLHSVEKQLAGFIGPMARILVKRAASRTTDQKELYSLLAESLDHEVDRQAFLGQRPGASKITTMYQSSTETRLPRAATQSANTVVPGCPELTPEVLARAARLLVPYVGPIANVLVKKEARRAKSLHSFYELLAEHVAGDTDRARFLRDAGI